MGDHFCWAEEVVAQDKFYCSMLLVVPHVKLQEYCIWVQILQDTSCVWNARIMLKRNNAGSLFQYRFLHLGYWIKTSKYIPNMVGSK